MTAPSANPARDRAPTTNPCLAPAAARSTTKTTMIQSTPVKARDVPGSPGGPSQRNRLAVVGALAAFALAAGIIVGASAGPDPAERAVDRFTAAWQRGDFARMWSLTDADTRAGQTTAQFAARYRAAAATATQSGIHFGHRGREHDGLVEVPAVVATRLWGPVRATLRLPVTGKGDAARVQWSSALLFPGLRPGERL